MFYKNVSYFAKTVYGVTFEPGDIKEVDKPVNNRWLIQVDTPSTNKQVSTQQKPSPEKPKKDSNQPDAAKQPAKPATKASE